MTKENLAVEKAPKKKLHKVVRALLMVAGTISLVVGAIGIPFPILPTTPFLLLAAACYIRSSDKMYNWLIGNKWFGSYIKNYREGKGIPLKTKIVAVSFLWITMLISAFFFVPLLVNVPTLIIQIILIAVATAVSIHIIRLPTFKKEP